MPAISAGRYRHGASLTGYAITYTLMFVACMVVLTHLAGKGAHA